MHTDREDAEMSTHTGGSRNASLNGTMGAGATCGAYVVDTFAVGTGTDTIAAEALVGATKMDPGGTRSPTQIVRLDDSRSICVGIDCTVSDGCTRQDIQSHFFAYIARFFV